jgi:thiol-disulfide isomerase/thioredoxin
MNIFIVVLLAITLLLVFYNNSKFTARQTSTTSTNSKYDSIDNNTVLIFYAPWCGHCKKSMGEFVKATEDPIAKVTLVNCDDPNAKRLIEKYSITGYPTIIKADGTVYDGERRSQDIIDFANDK